MELRLAILIAIYLILLVPIGVAANVVSDETKANMHTANVALIFPILAGLGATILYWKRDSKAEVDIEPPKFTLSQQ
jgi:hypothetical protein